MNVVFLGLGGNIGDRLENLRDTVNTLVLNCGEIVEQSSIYETEAWGSDSKKKYLNQVVKLYTLLSPEALLQKLLNIEEKLGRNRNENRNSDRTVDIDILLYDDLVLESENIQIPHPRLHLRKFVLIPLCEIAGKTTHPLFKLSMAELLLKCRDNLEVKKISEL